MSSDGKDVGLSRLQMRGLMDRQVTEGCGNGPSSVQLKMKCPAIRARGGAAGC